jgi:hypothetical protein
MRWFAATDGTLTWCVAIIRLCRRLPAINTAEEGMGRIAFLLLALFAEMERTSTAEHAAHARAVTEAAGWYVAHPASKIEYARLLQDLDQIATKLAISKTSLHRYLTDVDR